MYGPKREEVTGDWRKLRNAELNNLFSPKMTGVMKFRRLRWVGHVACMGEKISACRVMVGQRKGRVIC
jgi:hypothetical protein